MQRYTSYILSILINSSDAHDDICDEEDIAVDWLMQNNVNIEEQKNQNITGFESYSYPKHPLFVILSFSFTLNPFHLTCISYFFNRQTKSKKMHTLTLVMCFKTMG